MKNIELLFKKNKIPNMKLNNFSLHSKQNNKKSKVIVFDYYEKELDGNLLEKIIVNLENHNPYRLPAILYFHGDKLLISDKLSIILLECICYYMLNKCEIVIYWDVSTDIWTVGLENSPLRYLLPTNIYSTQLFKDYFYYPMGTRHYRKVLNPDNIESISLVYSDVLEIFKRYEMESECANKVAEAVAELIGNACEHAATDCLVDIDLTDNYDKREDDGQYYGINIAIINFSEKNIVHDLKNKIQNGDVFIGSRYQGVVEAYQYHKDYFNGLYSEDDFFMVSVFQKNISGGNKGKSGGTGLTKLIQSLQNLSELYKCFVVSGDLALLFSSDYLEFDKEEWLGFNKSKNYLSDIPSDKVLGYCPIYMPGTGYNLNFVMKRKVDD